MYQHILIATDGSEFAKKAIGQGLTLAKAIGAKVTVVSVEVPFSALGFIELGRDQINDAKARFTALERERASLTLGDVKVAAGKLGVPCEAIQLESTRPHQAIIQAADDKKCDLIVMGSHGRGGVSGALLGSVTMRVVTHTKIPVLICR